MKSHAARSGIVGGRSPEIAEFAAQLRRIRRLGKGSLRIEGIKRCAAGYGMNCAIPLRAMAAACRRPDGFQLKPAFFLNNPGEEFERQSVCRRGQNHAPGVNQAG